MVNKKFVLLNISGIGLILITVLFWMIFANFSFFAALFSAYPATAENIPFFATLAFGFTSAVVAVLLLVCFQLLFN